MGRRVWRTRGSSPSEWRENDQGDWQPPALTRSSDPYNVIVIDNNSNRYNTTQEVKAPNHPVQDITRGRTGRSPPVPIRKLYLEREHGSVRSIVSCSPVSTYVKRSPSQTRYDRGIGGLSKGYHQTRNHHHRYQTGRSGPATNSTGMRQYVHYNHNRRETVKWKAGIPQRQNAPFEERKEHNYPTEI